MAEGDDIDFSELLGEEGKDIVLKKDGEEVEKVEAPPVETKPANTEEKSSNQAGNSKKPAGKGKGGKKGKPIALGVVNDDDNGDGMTEEERIQLEEKLRAEDAKNAAALMGIDIKKSIDDVKLADEMDYNTFGKLIAIKVGTSAVRSNVVCFINSLCADLTNELTSEDVGKIQSKLTVIFNNKLKEEKGTTGGKKKNANKPKLNVERNPHRAGFDMYEHEGMEGTNDYGGYDEIDFM